MGSSPEEDLQNEQTLSRLIQEICSVPLASDDRTPRAATHESDSDNFMAELGEDDEIQELLLRKMRQKGLGRKLLAELLQGESGK